MLSVLDNLDASARAALAFVHCCKAAAAARVALVGRGTPTAARTGRGFAEGFVRSGCARALRPYELAAFVRPMLPSPRRDARLSTGSCTRA